MNSMAFELHILKKFDDFKEILANSIVNPMESSKLSCSIVPLNRCSEVNLKYIELAHFRRVKASGKVHISHVGTNRVSIHSKLHQH